MSETSTAVATEYASRTHQRNSEHMRRSMQQVLEMRTAGLTFPQIAREMGFTQKHAFTLWQKAMDAIIAPDVEKLRKQETERLDAMLVPCMSLIMTARDNALIGKPFDLPVDAINAALKISEKRSRLMGLDQPLKVVQKSIGSNTANDILDNMNLSAMDTAELLKFRELMQKAHTNPEPGDEDEEYGPAGD